MEPLMAIDKLEDLAQALYESDDSIARLQLLATIDSILSSLEKTKSIRGNTKENIDRVRWSLETICGLDSGNDHSDDQHYTWALGAIEALKSIHCFGEKQASIYSE